MKTKKIIFTITVIVLVAAFGVSAFFVANYIKDSKAEDERAQQLANLVAQSTTEATEPPATTKATEATETGATEAAPTEETEPTIRAEYQELYDTNNDMVGWIQIENTKLNYPVMQTPNDPSYYLKRNFDKQKSEWGAIYAWEAADLSKPSDNITVFGHNMKDGSMFATLNNYTHKYTWEDNSLIFFNTLYEYHTYKIFAVFKTSANLGEGFSYHQFVDAKDKADFDQFVKTCKDLAFYDTGITPQYGDKLLCLSTCEYTLDNGRLVVAAVRIT